MDAVEAALEDALEALEFCQFESIARCLNDYPAERRRIINHALHHVSGAQEMAWKLDRHDVGRALHVAWMRLHALLEAVHATEERSALERASSTECASTHHDRSYTDHREATER
jgi:hypothetical protein